MKKCPFCNAQIEDSAVKCDFCGESSDPVLALKSNTESPKNILVRRKNSAVSIVFSVLLTIALVFSATVGICFLLLRNALSGKVIETAVQTTIQNTDILEMPIGDSGTVVEAVEDVFKSTGNEQLAQLTTEEIKELAKEAGLDEAVTRLLNQFSGYLTGEQSEFSISTEEIMDIINDNLDGIESATGYRPTQEDLSIIETTLDEQTEEINRVATEVLSAPTVSTTVTTVRFAVGPTVPVIMGVVSALCILIILLILRRKEGVFLFTGIASAVVALFFGAAYVFSDVILSAVVSSAQLNATVLAVIDTVMAAVMSPVLTTVIILAGIFALCIALYVTVAILMKKSKKYAQAR